MKWKKDSWDWKKIIAKKILEFNKQNQEEKGLKILTPNQMLSRLPISLAEQFKKLKN